MGKTSFHLIGSSARPPPRELSSRDPAHFVNLNIGLKLALGQAVAYFVQWTIIGIVIGLIDKPLVTP
jgi:hypothetical protein